MKRRAKGVEVTETAAEFNARYRERERAATLMLCEAQWRETNEHRIQAKILHDMMVKYEDMLTTWVDPEVYIRLMIQLRRQANQLEPKPTREDFLR